MHFDDRHLAGKQDVEQGDRTVPISRRIDDNAGHPAARLLDAVDQLAFMVGLVEIDVKSELLRVLPAGLLDIGQAAAPINCRLARAEQIEIGSVEDEDRRGLAQESMPPSAVITCPWRV